MAIRESIVFEVDASAAAQGFAQMERGAEAMASSVSRADDALSAVQKEAAALSSATTAAGTAAASLSATVTTQATATASAAAQTETLTRALQSEASAAQTANVALESTARTIATTSRAAESASRGIGQVARASGEPIARLATILGGAELGSGVARMFQLERGIHSVGQVATAAGTGLARFLGPLGLIVVGVEAVSFALSLFSDDTSTATKEVEKLETASSKLAATNAAVSARLESLSGSDRMEALATAIGSVRSEITKLGEASKGESFESVDAARARVESIKDAYAEFHGVQSTVLREFQATSRLIGGKEFIPADLFAPMLRDFPAIAIALSDLQAEGVPGLIALQDAMNLLAEAQTTLAKTTAPAVSAFKDSLNAIEAETKAVHDRQSAVEQLIRGGVGLEAALRRVGDAQEAQIRTERAAADIARQGGEVDDAKRAALLKSAEAAIEAKRSFEAFVESQKSAIATSRELGQALSDVVADGFDKFKGVGGAIVGGVTGAAGAVAGGLGDAAQDRSRAAEAAEQIATGLRLEASAYSRTRTEVEKLALEEDIRANRVGKASAERLRQLQAEAQAMRRVREVGDALGGGAGDSLRALKDGASGREALQAGLQGAGDRLFDNAVRDIEERIGAGFASIFGGSFGLTVGDQAIVTAINQTTAAVQAAGVGGSGGAGGTGGAAAPSGGFDFGSFGASLAIGGLGVLAGQLGRRRSRGGNDDIFETAPFERGGRGAGTTYHQNRVTINNFGSADRVPLTGRQAKSDPSRFWR